jgi:hypothetical protein
MTKLWRNIRWRILAFIAKRWPTSLTHYAMLRAFVIGWIMCDPQARLSMVEHAFAGRVTAEGTIVAPLYLEGFRLYGGVQRSFRLVWKHLTGGEREKLTSAIVAKFAHPMRPDPGIDDASAAVIQIACVLGDVIPPDLLGTVEGLAAARESGASARHLPNL